MRLTCWVLSSLVMAVTAYGAEPAPTRKTKAGFLGPKEVLEKLEASPIRFEIKRIDELRDVGRGRLADELWKPHVQAVNLPKVERAKNGAVTITEWPQPPKARAELDKAEEAFKKKDFAQAAEHYRKALVIAPKLYIARAYLGDALLFGGDPAAARVEYEAAIKLNPDDYRLYFFRATAHRHLKEKEKMVDDLRASLALKPRNDILVGMIEKSRGQLGLRMEPDIFVPRAFVRREGDSVVIYADVERHEWLAWANCKALWLADEAHRQEMLGDASSAWSTTEELECLSNLLSVYVARKASGEGMGDDRLDRLKKIADEGLASGFVVYELGSRIDPQLVLRLDEKARETVRRYVDSYVLTERQD